METKSAYLQRTNVLQDLSAKEIDDIGHGTRLVKYPAGHLFYMPDDPGEVMFILKEGRVQLYRISPDGRKLVVAIMQPGAIFGHMALIGQRLHQTYAQALDDCTICVWNRESVEAVLAEKPRVALRFLDAVGQRLLQAEERLTEITFKHVPARLASLLLRLSAENGNTSELTGFTHQYLADMLGTYRETVTQTLNDFKSAALIKVSRKHIRLLNRAKLTEIMDGD